MRDMTLTLRDGRQTSRSPGCSVISWRTMTRRWGRSSTPARPSRSGSASPSLRYLIWWVETWKTKEGWDWPLILEKKHYDSCKDSTSLFHIQKHLHKVLNQIDSRMKRTKFWRQMCGLITSGMMICSNGTLQTLEALKSSRFPATSSGFPT